MLFRPKKLSIPLTADDVETLASLAMEEREARITPENQKWAQFTDELADYVQAVLDRSTPEERAALLAKMGADESVISTMMDGFGGPTLRTLAEWSVVLGVDLIRVPALEPADGKSAVAA